MQSQGDDWQIPLVIYPLHSLPGTCWPQCAHPPHRTNVRDISVLPLQTREHAVHCVILPSWLLRQHPGCYVTKPHEYCYEARRHVATVALITTYNNTESKRQNIVRRFEAPPFESRCLVKPSRCKRPRSVHVVNACGYHYKAISQPPLRKSHDVVTEGDAQLWDVCKRHS